MLATRLKICTKFEPTLNLEGSNSLGQEKYAEFIWYATCAIMTRQPLGKTIPKNIKNANHISLYKKIRQLVISEK